MARAQWGLRARTCTALLSVVLLAATVFAAPAAAAGETVSVSDATVTETDSGSVNATFTVTLSQPVGGTVTVDYATSDGTATAGSDYVSASGTVVFRPTVTQQTVTVTVLGDQIDEEDETFVVTLSNPAGGPSLFDGTGTGTIVDNDAPPTVSIDDVSVNEGNAGIALASFSASLSGASAKIVTVDFATADGTARAGTDYTAGSGSLTFSPGETTKPIGIDVMGDVLDEFNETYTVSLTNPSNATCGDCSGTGTITDDDATPTLSIDDVHVTEGDAGTTDATFTVTLSPASGRTVTVDYATAADTATSGADYTATSGTLTFASGDTTKAITVPVVGDTLHEADETYDIDLTSAQNATTADAQGIGTITDDDGAPSLSINDVVVTEGGVALPATAEFTVELSAASGATVTVDYATADGTAEAGLTGDYLAENGTLTFEPGQTSKTIAVDILGDTTDEVDETFSVNLSSSSNALIGDGSGLGTINDDDGPSLSIADVAVSEGDDGTTSATFTVAADAFSRQDITVDYATSDDTATTADGDYEAASGRATIKAGARGTSFTVTIASDLLDEPDETFIVTMTNPVDASCGDCEAIATINDDDATPSLSIDDQTVTEGDTGTADATFTVTLGAASGRTVTVDYATADAAAEAGTDYAATSGTLTFEPGATTKSIVVQVNGDLADEPNEDFHVNLSNPQHATVVTDTPGVGTIADDDGAPSLSVSDAEVTEGDSGTVSLTFVVTLSAQSTKTITVDAATQDDTATAPGDYQTSSGTLTFLPGETTKQVAIAVNGDTAHEEHEELGLLLSNETAATIGDGSGVGTILDDDDPTMSISDATAAEGAGSLAFDVSLSSPALRPVSVQVATSDGSATAGDDYGANSLTLEFEAGSQTKQFTVPIVDDSIDESDETLNVTLSDATGATISDGSGLGTITDDDVSPTVEFASATYRTGESNGAVELTVLLSAPSGKTITVDYVTGDGTANSTLDYTPSPLLGNQVTFNPGETSKTITITITNDSNDEADESFNVTLSAPSNATLGDDNPAIVTIVDDDGPSISINDVTVTEGDSGSLDATFTVALSASSPQTVTVRYATSDGTATQRSDYQPTAGTLTFAPSETSKTLTVPVIGDTTDEPNEEFLIDLSESTNATIAGGRGAGSITDDDEPATLTIGDVIVNEGDSGTVGGVFTVTLSPPSGKTVLVDYATADGTAVAPGDYQSSAGSLAFSPGTSTNTITVPVVGDTLDEVDETFSVDLTNATNATLGDARGQALITDDDAARGGGGGGGSGGGGGGGGGSPTETTTSSDPAGTEPSGDNPLIITVTAPSSDPVTIIKTQGNDPGSDFHALGFGADITGPDATVEDPLVLEFQLLEDSLPSATLPTTVEVFRNGTMVSDCPGSTTAVPDPCVSSRTSDGSIVTITVLTSKLSAWDFALERLTTRLAGNDRVATAIETSEQTFRTTDSAGAVVLSRSEGYADALAGTPLAIAQNAPLLLTHPTVLHQTVEDEIERVLPAGGTVHLLGGSTALDTSIEGRLHDLGYDTVRHAGENRYATAVRIARALGDPSTQFIATGTNFADALSGGSAAGQIGASVLLTAGSTMPADTKEYLDSLPDSTRYALGGPAATAAKSAGVEATTVAGADRFDTSVQIAKRFFLEAEQVSVAYGLDFPDSLSGGVHAGHHDAPLLLVLTDTVPTVLETYLDTLGDRVAYGWVYGGSAVVSDSVVNSVRSSLIM